MSPAFPLSACGRAARAPLRRRGPVDADAQASLASRSRPSAAHAALAAAKRRIVPSMSRGRSSRRLVVPLGAVGVEEVAAVHVERHGVLALRVRDRVDRVLAEHEHVAGHERSSAGRLEPVRRAPVVAVVLLPAVHPDDREHPVVVRVELHPRRPRDVQHREVGRPVQRPDPTLGDRSDRGGERARRPHELGRRRHGPRARRVLTDRGRGSARRCRRR